MDKKSHFRALTRREFIILSGAGVAGITLAGTLRRAEAAEEKPKYGGRLRVSERFGSPGLDAHKNQDMMDYQNYCLMYGGLTEIGKLPEVEIYPMLASSWDISKDGREYTFALREGVKFHHGKELDSGDVKYSMERVMNPATRSPRAFAFKCVDSVQAVDRYVVKIRLKEPFAPFLSTLTVHNCSIIPAGWEPTGMKPAPGTGPYVFKSLVPNETTEFTRFDRYWETDERTGNRLPYLDTIHVKKIVDDTVRLTALRSGDLDLIANPPQHVMARAIVEKPIPGVRMDYESVGSAWLWFNCTKAPFDQKKVRQAVAHAVDKNAFVKAVYWGLAETVNNQPFQKGSRFYIPVEDRETNRARARQLLAEAGYPNGFKTEILVLSVQYYVDGCQTIAGQLKEAGIDATLKMIDRAAYMATIRKGDYSVSYMVEPERYDPDDAYYMYLHSGEIGKNNASRYANQEMDALLEKGRTTTRWEDRRPVYRKIVEIVKEDLPLLHLSKSVAGIALREGVKGYRKGFGVRFGWHGGGLKYMWLDQ